MGNITLKIDDDLLKKARRLALLKSTSINALIRQRLEQFIEGDPSREAAIKDLESFYQRSHVKVGKKTWSRDELHER